MRSNVTVRADTSRAVRYTGWRPSSNTGLGDVDAWGVDANGGLVGIDIDGGRFE
ncbi:MAG TPA: hypothetical protein VII16_16920 [Actinomycetes bacterium]|jgi:hypothetical protein